MSSRRVLRSAQPPQEQLVSSRRVLRSAQPPQEQLEPVVTLPAELTGEIGRRNNRSKRVKLEHEDGMFSRVRHERESAPFTVAQLRDEVKQFLHPIAANIRKPALVFSACCSDSAAQRIIVAQLRKVAASQDWRELWVYTGQIREWLQSGVTRSGAERPWWVREAWAARPPSEVAEVVEVADAAAVDVTKDEGVENTSTHVKLDVSEQPASNHAHDVPEQLTSNPDDLKLLWSLLVPHLELFTECGIRPDRTDQHRRADENARYARLFELLDRVDTIDFDAPLLLADIPGLEVDDDGYVHLPDGRALRQDDRLLLIPEWLLFYINSTNGITKQTARHRGSYPDWDGVPIWLTDLLSCPGCLHTQEAIDASFKVSWLRHRYNLGSYVRQALRTAARQSKKDSEAVD
jgi:hypothetical protein